MWRLKTKANIFFLREDESKHIVKYLKIVGLQKMLENHDVVEYLKEFGSRKIKEKY